MLHEIKTDSADEVLDKVAGLPQIPSLDETKKSAVSFKTPILTRLDYQTTPPISELKKLFDNEGMCWLNEFTITHDTYGSVTFYGKMNIAGLNLDEISKTFL